MQSHRAGHPCLAVNDWVDKKCIECGADKPKWAAPPRGKEPEIAKDRVAAEGSVLSDETGLNIKEVEKVKDVEFARAAIKNPRMVMNISMLSSNWSMSSGLSQCHS
jgi:hypothetical protein